MHKQKMILFNLKIFHESIR